MEARVRLTPVGQSFLCDGEEKMVFYSTLLLTVDLDSQKVLLVLLLREIGRVLLLPRRRPLYVERVNGKL
jgi:hypothetical protein